MTYQSNGNQRLLRETQLGSPFLSKKTADVNIWSQEGKDQRSTEEAGRRKLLALPSHLTEWDCLAVPKASRSSEIPLYPLRSDQWFIDQEGIKKTHWTKKEKKPTENVILRWALQVSGTRESSEEAKVLNSAEFLLDALIRSTNIAWTCRALFSALGIRLLSIRSDRLSSWRW